MIDSWLLALEAAEPVRALRASTWVYPLVSAGHILGFSILVGSVLPLDLRLLGAWRSVALEPLWRVLGASALAGLVLAVACGAALFAVNASEYAQSPVFVAKMIVVAIGVGNAAWLRRAAPSLLRDGAAVPAIPWQLRTAALVSLLAWTGTLLLGRLIAYF